jgi:hypothetical protein
MHNRPLGRAVERLASCASARLELAEAHCDKVRHDENVDQR